jgi:hypothetical protein
MYVRNREWIRMPWPFASSAGWAFAWGMLLRKNYWSGMSLIGGLERNELNIPRPYLGLSAPNVNSQGNRESKWSKAKGAVRNFETEDV